MVTPCVSLQIKFILAFYIRKKNQHFFIFVFPNFSLYFFLAAKINEFDIIEDNNFLVLYNRNDSQVYAIYSRTLNITEESLRTYKNIASIEQYYLHYGDHRTCVQRTIAQWRFDLVIFK